jgi:hypothetical protein
MLAFVHDNPTRKAVRARNPANAARNAARKAAAKARRQEVRTKNIANKSGTPPPDIDAPGTRFDINYYSGGPSHIRDIGVIEKRKK